MRSRRTYSFAAMSEDTRTMIVEAFEAWSRGDQPGAVERVRPAAGQGDRVALALICWFLAQRGEPYWREGVPYAEKATAKGISFVANYYLGNMLSDSALRQRLPELLRPALQAGLQFDPIASAQQPFQQGDHATATRLVELATIPVAQPEAWHDFLATVQQEWDQLSGAAGDVLHLREEALDAIRSTTAEVEGARQEVQTRTQQLMTLLDQTTNAEVQSFFDTEATKYENEARFLWRWSIILLIVTALFSVAPIVIYYVGTATGHAWLHDQNLIAAHLAPAVALGAVAGVLLARARGRDRARQRNRDLSVALGTMFVYSGQIASEDERQRFLHEMGRTVIEAFLRQDAPLGEDNGSSFLSALSRRG
jgi:hypothetical protein